MHLNCMNNEFFKRTLDLIAHFFAASLEPANWQSNSRVMNSRIKCTVKMQTCINVCSYSFSLDCQLILWFIIYILGKTKPKKLPWTVPRTATGAVLDCALQIRELSREGSLHSLTQNQKRTCIVTVLLTKVWSLYYILKKWRYSRVAWVKT